MGFTTLVSSRMKVYLLETQGEKNFFEDRIWSLINASKEFLVTDPGKTKSAGKWRSGMPDVRQLWGVPSLRKLMPPGLSSEAMVFASCRCLSSDHGRGTGRGAGGNNSGLEKVILCLG